MGLLTGVQMFLLIWLLWLPAHTSSLSSARALDALLQHYAYRSFVPRPRTGVVYDGQVPSNLTGIKVAGLRLRSGSLRTRGFQMYKEFQLPVGVVEERYVERLVFVYHNLGNWSSLYYSLPAGYVFLAPILGLLAYDASNLSATNLPELDIRASGHPISIRFSEVMAKTTVPHGLVPKCVSFDLQGLLNFSDVLLDNTCAAFREGHFSIVVESTAPSPAPVPSMAVLPPPAAGGGKGSQGGKKDNSKQIWIIVGSLLGGLALLVLLGLLVIWMLKFKTRKKMQQMEKAAEVGEALHMTRVGSTKAPAATVTRTQPTIETEYLP
ncbi:hypothetical protein ACH5RR_005084 [Cinchona calisaya]|uniref:Uncharacterized protein n=1 Tax=Cinchona calisaya TaxID=153742 RepID=A0ABD3AZT2_9GENT